MDARTYIYYNVRGRADSVKKGHSILFFVESAHKKPRLKEINLGFNLIMGVAMIIQTDLLKYRRLIVLNSYLRHPSLRPHL